MADKFLIVKWLLQNTSVLKDIAGIVSGWSDSLSLTQKLEIVYLIAKAVLPIIETFPLFQASALSDGEKEEVLATAQAECGVAIPILLTVVVPIVSTMIQVIVARRNHT